MDNKNFEKNYSNVYDILYKKKNYEKECDYLEKIFEGIELNVKTILDIGCGTGGHLIPLINRGYDVFGVDKSKWMLEQVTNKLKNLKVDAELIKGDMAKINLGRKFDSVISMFSVINYQTTSIKLRSACQNAFNHLNNTGVFIFDAWNGGAVLSEKPKREKLVSESNDISIIRYTYPALNIINQTCEINFTLNIKRGNRSISLHKESHLLRFFLPEEIKSILKSIGFSSIKITPFLEVDRFLRTSDWNMSVVAIKN